MYASVQLKIRSLDLTINGGTIASSLEEFFRHLNRFGTSAISKLEPKEKQNKKIKNKKEWYTNHRGNGRESFCLNKNFNSEESPPNPSQMHL